MPGLPRALDDICVRALAKNPAARYRRAKDLVDDACLAIGPTDARPSSPSSVGPDVFAPARGVPGAYLASDIPLTTINYLRARCAIPQDETVLSAIQ